MPRTPRTNTSNIIGVALVAEGGNGAPPGSHDSEGLWYLHCVFARGSRHRGMGTRLAKI